MDSAKSAECRKLPGLSTCHQFPSLLFALRKMCYMKCPDTYIYILKLLNTQLSNGFVIKLAAYNRGRRRPSPDCGSVGSDGKISILQYSQCRSITITPEVILYTTSNEGFHQTTTPQHLSHTRDIQTNQRFLSTILVRSKEKYFQNTRQQSIFTKLMPDSICNIPCADWSHN